MFEDAFREAERFKWIESEKVGRDLGETAIRQWMAQHWSTFARTRVLEHLTGKRFWIELDRGDFGVLDRAFPHQQELVREIVSRFANGADNLTVLTWAIETSQPMNTVYEILQAIDINRFHHFDRFFHEPAPPRDDDADTPHIVQE